MLVGVSLYWLLPDSPEVAYVPGLGRQLSDGCGWLFGLTLFRSVNLCSWYLTAEDKELMAIRYRQSAIYNGNQHFEWAKVRASLADPRLYLSGTAQLCECD